MIADMIFALYEESGNDAYFGEPVTVISHSLQAAYFGRRSGAADALVLAALLHDVGHLVDPAPADIADWKVDAHHEVIGSQWIARRFGIDVSEPVRLHVPAKRYLCAVDADYFGLLSPASVMTLKLQGGPMSREEVTAFEAMPHFEDAVLLRQWDEQAKVAGLPVPGLEDYRALIERLAL